jgi:serine/threonine protein kinase
VKIARSHLLDGPHAAQIRRRFADEIRAITRIRHPNLVQLFKAGQTPEGLPAIAMEFIEGATLGEHLRTLRGPMPIEEVAICFEQLASAVPGSFTVISHRTT